MKIFLKIVGFFVFVLIVAYRHFRYSENWDNPPFSGAIRWIGDTLGFKTEHFTGAGHLSGSYLCWNVGGLCIDSIFSYVVMALIILFSLQFIFWFFWPFVCAGFSGALRLREKAIHFQKN